MATVQIYEEESNQYFQVNVTMAQNVLDIGTGAFVLYLKVNTTIKNPLTGGSLPEFSVRTLYDVPPGAYSSPAADFTELVNDYINYYITYGELGQSSSSSNSSSSSSSFDYSVSTSSSLSTESSSIDSSSSSNSSSISDNSSSSPSESSKSTSSSSDSSSTEWMSTSSSNSSSTEWMSTSSSSSSSTIP